MKFTGGTLLALALVAMVVLPTQAQQPRIRHIAYLQASSADRTAPNLAALIDRMRELGYVRGTHFALEERYADDRNERLPALAAELAAGTPDVIVAVGAPAINAARRATSNIPIVFPVSADPVGAGFAASLTRPGGNLTGQSNNVIETCGKQLELLKRVAPRVSRVALLINPNNTSHAGLATALRQPAARQGISIVVVRAGTPEAIELSFAAMRRERADALLVAPDAFLNSQSKRIGPLALAHRLPSLFTFRESVADGGLMSYGQSVLEFFRGAAGYVDRILRGAKPGDIPIEAPTKFQLVLNRRTASALGLPVTQEVRLLADEVIE